MLQIISGKFFKSDNRYVHEAKGITYSNYSWIGPIKTCVATLEPVDTYGSFSSYVISYINQIEKEKASVLVRIGDSEIVQQFQLLSMFGLKAFFDINRNNVEINCREKPKNSADRYLPSRFIPRFFESQIGGKMDEIEAFIKFVDKVIGLPREKYLAVINCLNNFSHALQVLNYNFDLAYSMLVYSLESLSQSFDKFEPTWEDYNPEINKELDRCLSKISLDVAKDIRKVLLKSSNLRLQHRFIDFITNHISDSFFTDEAIEIKFALRKSELKRTLRNAYTMRSKYAHLLEPIQKQLRDPQIAEGDVFHWENEPYLTFGGLTRLAYHVINNFIWKQDYLKIEEYDWKKDLPGIVWMKLAPQYWIWKEEGFVPSHATKKFSGFLTHLQETILSDGSLVDLRKLLEKYEDLVPTAKKKDKIPMLAMYYLYDLIIKEEARMPNYNDFLKQYEDVFNECCIEMMIVYLLSKQKWPWDIEECVSHYDDYKKNKFSKNALSVPLLIELCLIVEIANMYSRAEKLDKYNEWLSTACLEASGKPAIQKFINECKSKGIEVDCKLILKPLKTKGEALLRKVKRTKNQMWRSP